MENFNINCLFVIRIFREREKQELKSKITELEEFKDKYENEKKENEVTFIRW